jgi:hypothetical protein
MWFERVTDPKEATVHGMVQRRDITVCLFRCIVEPKMSIRTTKSGRLPGRFIMVKAASED